jgi:hypothetical protein
VIAGAEHVAGEEGGVARDAPRHAPKGEVRVRHEHLLGLSAL